MSGTRIVKVLDYQAYKELIHHYKNKITVNPHAHFRLNEAQRKVFKDEVLIDMLEQETPALIGIQQNERYAALFRRKDGYLRIIFQVYPDKNIEIITFYITETLPKI
ncbi:hypothetical protein HYS50_00245 [Candidatus Woesearchaeota archaeon]|nr:hypothetical protein [Candidatus Woesearchaeota archaeon]